MTKNDLIDCHDRIKPFIHNTPVLTSKLINNLTGADIYFKCENFQKMGAFKMRGAANAILKLSGEQKMNGVVTHSSGNHAQAISLAAKKIGIKAYIVMPSNAPEIKKITDHERYIFYNNLVLSNTRIANLFNFPAITMPIKKNYWLSFSVFCKQKKDENLLSSFKKIKIDNFFSLVISIFLKLNLQNLN